MATEVRVAGVGMTRFGKLPGRGLKDLGAEAVGAALADAGLGTHDIGFSAVGNAVAGLITGQECIRGQLVLREAGIGHGPVVNVENACASGSTALHLCWQAIQAGQADIALAVGVEKLTHPDKATSLGAFAAGVDVELRAAATAPDGPPPDRSVFMDLYAAAIREHMDRHGTTREQMAQLAVKSHRFGARNPYAQHQREVTLEEVLQDREVVAPLTRMMCSPIGDGAAAVVLVSAAAAHRRGLRGRPRLRASVLRSGSLPGSSQASAERRAVDAAYEAAGIGPADLDVAEVHDATSPAELLAYEDLGLCGPGEGGRLVDTGATDLGGACPVNTSGGLVSRGHPVGATGLAQIVELSWQLRGLAEGRQVKGARLALAQNGGGSLGNDTAAQAVHVLEG